MSEFAVVWANVNEGILNKSWDRANDAKTSIQENERQVKGKRGGKKHEVKRGIIVARTTVFSHGQLYLAFLKVETKTV